MAALSIAVTEGEIKNLVRDGAKEALQEFLLVLGVNVATPADKLELQRDFAHLRTERLAIGNVRDKVLATITGTAVTSALGVIGYYVLHGPK